MVEAKTFLTNQSFLGFTPNILPVWLHFWVQTWYWQGEHRRLHALVFISLSTINVNIITILIMACFHHICVVGTTPARTPTSAIPGEPKSSCKRYLVAFLQRGANITPLLWPNGFKPLQYDFLPLRCAHCLPDCESTYYTSSVSATPLRRSLSLKVKRLLSQKFSWKCSFMISKHPFQMWHKEHRADNAL